MIQSNASARDKASDPFSALHKYQYTQLTTFRKDGSAIPTPVWFAPDQGKLYVMTLSTAGKVKRINNNGQAWLAPCNASGKVLGDRVEARARILPASENEHAASVLTGKYGFMYRVFAFFQNVRKVNRIFLEFEPA